MENPSFIYHDFLLAVPNNFYMAGIVSDVFIPVQITPSPCHPTLHWHEKLPILFKHTACWWQSSKSSSHSFISVIFMDM